MHGSDEIQGDLPAVGLIEGPHAPAATCEGCRELLAELPDGGGTVTTAQHFVERGYHTLRRDRVLARPVWRALEEPRRYHFAGIRVGS